MHARKGSEFVLLHALLGKAARITCLVARSLGSFEGVTDYLAGRMDCRSPWYRSA